MPSCTADIMEVEYVQRPPPSMHRGLVNRGGEYTETKKVFQKMRQRSRHTSVVQHQQEQKPFLST